ncbi:response regulator transcription factor [Paraburkholderia sp.]|uniref:response regulator transcription factor n=1 Tax=Paraburkholderia sp. TaxID=1926495 RepID=UPI00239E1B9D|nr:response regulator transcription factor [Paraburkholderia sp.]MDE1179618.1 response regulator transcription factor [Paraburkholderia sp.]
MTKIIRVIVADDHACVRLGVCHLLEARRSVAIVGEAPDTETLAELMDSTPHDVIVSDISMPGIHGGINAVPFLRRILRDSPPPRVVVLTMIGHPNLLTGLLQIGAMAIVDKRDAAHALVLAIDAVMAGDVYLSPLVSEAIYPDGDLAQPRTGMLSAREWEVFRFYAQGMPVFEIAQRLGRSGKTISTQKRSAMRKLGLACDAELIDYARQLGLN